MSKGRLPGWATRKGRLLRVAVLALLPAVAASQTWEPLPLVPIYNDWSQQVHRVDFLRAEGSDATDPSLDSLLTFRPIARLLLYNPGGVHGAAGDNGVYGAWHTLCAGSYCAPDDGLVTASNAILHGSRNRLLRRSTNRGRTWATVADSLYAIPLHESALTALAGANGHGLVAVIGDDGTVETSTADGASGTWARGGVGGGLAETLGEVPPSAALPSGRLLMGVWNGVSGSTDGGQSFQATSLYGFGRWIGYSFAFVPQAEHPYGGVAFAAVLNTALYPSSPAGEVHRSDDGGQTWTLAHRFTGEETGLPLYRDPEGINPDSYLLGQSALLAAPDGVLWASVNALPGGPVQPGVIMRSADLGQTWARADAGFEGYTGIQIPTPASFGWRVRRFALSRTGVLYAATDRGVWRTTAPVVSGEAWPTPASVGLSLSVAPNPSRGPVTLSLSARETQRVRVVVSDVTGREVWAGEAWATPEGASVAVYASSWASGVYVARASVGRHTEHVTARFTVAR